MLGPIADQQSPWYYPSIGEYAPLLERHGLEVRNASLFDRPTPLEGENGLDQWLRMFGQTYLAPVLCRTASTASLASWWSNFARHSIETAFGQ